MSNIKSSSFKKFLYSAHLKTYAGTEEERQKTRCAPPRAIGHKEYCYKEGDWQYYDSYAGHTFPPGKEVVHYKDKPFWTMTYQGQFIENSPVSIEETYHFLKTALHETSVGSPFRGKNNFRQQGWKYIFNMSGDWQYFIGREEIYFDNRLVFFQDIMGSIIK